MRVEVEFEPGDVLIDELDIVWIPFGHVKDTPKEILEPKKAGTAATTPA